MAPCEEELSSTQDWSPWGVSIPWKGVRMEGFRVHVSSGPGSRCKRGSGTLRPLLEWCVPVAGPLVAVCCPGESPEPGPEYRGLEPGTVLGTL